MPRRSRALLALTLASVTALAVAGVLVVVTGDQASPGRPTERIVGVGFEDVVGGADDIRQIAGHLDDVEANGVSVGVGRPDWTSFPWPGHEEAWSAQVEAADGADLLADALAAVGADDDGRDRYVTAVVDVFVERWIAEDPSLAGISAEGAASTSAPSVTALTEGPVGDGIVELVGYVARTYDVDAVSLTELFLDTHTFGDDDLRSYASATGEDDWPRTSTGEIDVTDAGLTGWRVAAVATVVERAAAAAHEEGVELWAEVRANWEEPGGDRLDSGHDYAALLDAADRLVIWAYFGLADRDATYVEEIAEALADRGDRIVMSIGLWTTDDGAISSGELRTAMDGSVRGGLTSVWVTPASLLTDDAWAQLGKAWRAQDR